MIRWVETWQAWEKTTICLVTLDNWHEVVWYAHCMNADNYDFEIWKEEAYKNACDKIWDIYAFLYADNNCDEEDEEDDDSLIHHICCKARHYHK